MIDEEKTQRVKAKAALTVKLLQRPHAMGIKKSDLSFKFDVTDALFFI
jgi:hypothetical protein